MRRSLGSLIALFSLCLSLSAQISMPKFNGQSKQTQITQPQAFYDDGGPTKNASAHHLTAMAFLPQPGEAIEVTFSELDLGDGVLYIYDGKKTLSSEYDELDDETTYSRPAGTPLYTLRGNSRPTALIHATGSDGALTFVYEGQAKPGAGWTAEVKSAKKRSIDQLPPADPAGSVWMHKGDRTVEVGTDELKFYDDGGPTGNISKDFIGSVTFVPKNPGEIIQLTFEQLDLFNTSSLRNDILQIYSGRSTTDRSKLLRTLLKESTPITLLSPESDGSLTVSLKSTTGFPKPGFVASVKAITPQAMHFTAATTTSTSASEKVRAGLRDYALQRLLIQTDGTKDPLRLEQITFDLSGTDPAVISELSLYAGSTITPSQRLGTLRPDASGTTATLALDASKIHLLSYGTNTFTLAATISEEAQPSQHLSLRITGIQLTGQAHPITTPASTLLTIENSYASLEGNHLIHVHSPWIFTATMSGNHYAGGNKDQVTTFLPHAPGELVEIDFSAFDIYYSSTSYGAKGSFAVYAGKDKRGKLLWKLDKDTRTTPPTLLRSTSEDGALTVVFNPNEHTSAYLGKGWTATVRSAKPSPQKLVSCEVSQASQAAAAIGAQDQEFLDFTLLTAGQLDPKTFDKLELHTTGGASAFTKLHLYSLPAPKDYAHRTLLGEVTPSGQDATLSLTTPLTLPEGKSYYLLTADLSDAIATGTALDVRLTGITLSGEATTITTGDPAGVRLAERIYQLQPGKKDVRSVTEPLRFVPELTEAGKLPTKKQGQVTFVPRQGEVIRVHFKQVNLAYADTLSFYHGRIIAKEHLANSLRGRKQGLADLVSTAEDGSITVVLGTGAYPGSGWDIEVSSIRPAAMKVTEVTLHPVTPTPRLLPGMKAIPLLRLDIQVEGEYGSADLTSLTLGDPFPAGSSSWATLRLYDTGTTTSFSHGLIVGSTSPTAPTTISGKASYSKAGVYHLFLAADVASDAKAGEGAPQLSLLPHALTIGGKELALPALETPLTLSLSQGVHGTFTIGEGTGTNYKTLTAAVQDLRERGIDGPVTLQLLPGRYGEDVLLPAIPGLSEANRLTIEPRDAGSSVIFENEHYRQIDYGDDKTGYFTLDGASYVTLRDLQFVTAKSKAPALVQLQSGSQHVTFEGCSFTAPRITQSVQGSIALVTTHRGKSLLKDNNDLTLRHCHFEGGYHAVNVSGLSTVNLPLQRGLTIDSCDFAGQGSKIIYANEVLDLKIRGNVLRASGEADANFEAIDITLTDKAEFSGNRLHIGQITGKVSSVIGLSLRNSRKENPTKAKARIFNNELILQANTPGQAVRAIEIAYADIISLELLHNSVYIHGASTHGETMVLAVHPRGGSEVAWLTMRNNLFQNETAGYLFHFTEKAKLTHQSIGENAYYSQGDKFATYGGSELSFLKWKPQLSDLSSREVQTTFVDATTSLLPKDFSKLTFAKQLKQVPSDLLGTARKSYGGAVGAYERRAVTLPDLRTGYPKPITSGGKITGLQLKFSDFGRLHYLLLPATESAPTLTQLQQAPLTPSLAPDIEQAIELTGLDETTDYRFYYLPQSSDGVDGSEVKSIELAGKISQLQPADFEETALGTSPFVAGSWRFSGVEVVSSTSSYSPTSTHALKLSASSAIELKNKRQTFVHTGFYLLSQASLTLTATGEGAATQSKTIPSTGGQWRYVSLRDLGAFSALTLASAGETFIDDFGATPQPLSVSTTDQQAEAGTAVTLTASVTGGVWPYTFRWENSRGEAVAETEDYHLTPESSTSYTLSVTDSWGQTQRARKQLFVRGKAALATFEDLALQPNSNWHGEASTDASKEYVSSSFFSGSYVFSNIYSAKNQYWGGFAYANQIGKDYKTLFPDQFNSATGSGANGSKTYAIAYPLGTKTEITVTHADQDVIPGMYITNSAWTLEFARSGAGILPGGSEAIKQGDFLLLKVTASPSGKSLEVPLIDYRSSDPREHYLLDAWQWINLESLGQVSKLSFTLTDSRKGRSIPYYFCLDDLGSQAPAQEASRQALAPQQRQELALEKLFADAALPLESTKPAHYEVVSTRGTAAVLATITEAGKLQLQALGEGEGSLLLLRRQGGKYTYLRLPLAVSKTTPVDEVSLQQQIQLYPNPATSEIRLQVPGEVAIYSLTGTCLYATKSYQAGDVINVSSWTPGVYLVRTSLGTIRLLKR